MSPDTEKSETFQTEVATTENSANTETVESQNQFTELSENLPPIETELPPPPSSFSVNSNKPIEQVGWQDVPNHPNGFDNEGSQLKVVSDEIIVDDVEGISENVEVSPLTSVFAKLTDILLKLGLSEEDLESPETTLAALEKFGIGVIPVGIPIEAIPDGQKMLAEGTKLLLGKEEIVLASEALIHWSKPEYSLAGALALSGHENMLKNNQHLELNYDSFGSLLPLQNQPGSDDLPKFCAKISPEEAQALGIRDYESLKKIFETRSEVATDEIV